MKNYYRCLSAEDRIYKVHSSPNGFLLWSRPSTGNRIGCAKVHGFGPDPYSAICDAINQGSVSEETAWELLEAVQLEAVQPNS